MRVWESGDENALMEEHKTEEVGEGKERGSGRYSRFWAKFGFGLALVGLGGRLAASGLQEMALSGWPSGTSGGPVGRVSWAGRPGSGTSS